MPKATQNGRLLIWDSLAPKLRFKTTVLKAFFPLLLLQVQISVTVTMDLVSRASPGEGISLGPPFQYRVRGRFHPQVNCHHCSNGWVWGIRKRNFYLTHGEEI